MAQYYEDLKKGSQEGNVIYSTIPTRFAKFLQGAP